MRPACRRRRRIAGALLLLLSLSAGCTPQSERPQSRSEEEGRQGDAGRMRPFPYTTPVPDLTPTAADGVYMRRVTVAQAGGAPVPCRRCAPYRFDAGHSKLELDSGRYFLSHRPSSPKVQRFASTGYYLVKGDRIVFFNDPNCTTTRGSYTWDESATELIFRPRSDSCGIGLRAEWLSALPWTKQAGS